MKTPHIRYLWILAAVVSGAALAAGYLGRVSAETLTARPVETAPQVSEPHFVEAGGYASPLFAPLTPTAPASLTATAVLSSQIVLTWTNIDSSVLGFTVERSLTGALPWVDIVKVVTPTLTYTDGSRSCSTAYYYQVIAYNTAGASRPSSVVSATTFPCAPSALTATALSATQIKLSWVDNSPDESGFKIERSPDGISSWTQITSVVSNTTAYTDTNLSCYTVYYYRVRAYTRLANSDYSNIASAQSQMCKTYMPTVWNSSPVAISGLEVTQSVQNPSNSVSMVAGRATVVRVYVYTKGAQPIPNVRVSLSATQNGAPLPGSPVVVGPKVAPVSPSRAVYDSSFNVQIPIGWTSGQVVLTAVAYVGTTPTPFVNSMSTLTLNFNAVPPLNIRVVPILYTHTPTGVTYPPPSASDLGDWIMRAYPVSTVNITTRAPYAFTGDLSSPNDWTNLLNQITSLKSTEVGINSSTVYYGFIAANWFSGGIVGLGWTNGWRASIGLDLSAAWPGGTDAAGLTAAHEIGHNLGRLHAPCGGVADPDPNYPYAGGSIGQFGLDIIRGVPYDPSTASDVMGYCNPPIWVSDYTYQGLYNNQIVFGAQVVNPAASGLLVRAVFDSQNQPALQSVYALNGPLTETPAASDYQVALLDAAGRVIASYPVAVMEATLDNSGQTVHAISAVLPRPAQPVASVRLLHAGQPVAEKKMAAPALAPAEAPSVVRAPGEVTLRWGTPNVPAVVRYTADDGQTWTTLGLDVLGGELKLDPANLPAGAGRFEILLADTAASNTLTVPFAP